MPLTPASAGLAEATGAGGRDDRRGHGAERVIGLRDVGAAGSGTGAGGGTAGADAGAAAGASAMRQLIPNSPPRRSGSVVMATVGGATSEKPLPRACASRYVASSWVSVVS